MVLYFTGLEIQASDLAVLVKDAFELTLDISKMERYQIHMRLLLYIISAETEACNC